MVTDVADTIQSMEAIYMEKRTAIYATTKAEKPMRTNVVLVTLKVSVIVLPKGLALWCS